MNKVKRTTRQLFWALFLSGLAFPFAGCGPGTVYVGVAAPGPWVGYPGRGYYPGYPGYGRPWYSPNQEDLEQALPRGQMGPPEAPAPPPWSPLPHR
ncbi:MAG: hypothetical protein ACWGSQ_20805 [Longimicrobiales bacterium]